MNNQEEKYSLDKDITYLQVKYGVNFIEKLNNRLNEVKTLKSLNDFEKEKSMIKKKFINIYMNNND